jgi:hypothetical protein
VPIGIRISTMLRVAGPVKMVAGARNHLYRTFMAWTEPYRLGFLGAEQICHRSHRE